MLQRFSCYEGKTKMKSLEQKDCILIAEFEGDIVLTKQGSLFVAEVKNGLIAIGSNGNEAFFNLDVAYGNKEEMKL
jgi:hypothetical protein